MNRVGVPADAAGIRGPEALAEKIAGKLGSARADRQARLLRPDPAAGSDKAYEMTGAVMVENMLDRDTNEGIAAFLEKRAPDWQQELTAPDSRASRRHGRLRSAAAGWHPASGCDCARDGGCRTGWKEPGPEEGAAAPRPSASPPPTS